MTSRSLMAGMLLTLAGCFAGHHPPSSTPAPAAADASVGRARADSLWRKAIREFRRGSFAKASEVFQRVLLEIPAGDPRIPEVHFFLAESYFGGRSQLQAVREFRKVSDDFPTHPLAPDALDRAGDAYADLWRKEELDPTYGRSASATYTELLNRYPESRAAAKAREQLEVLSERFASKEWDAARYYLRYKYYDAAILYMKSLVAAYPNTPAAEQALVQLVATYRLLGYKEDATEICGALRRYHPGAKDLDRLCPAAGG
jgi:outer membrane protein assembly factor BamD